MNAWWKERLNALKQLPKFPTAILLSVVGWITADPIKDVVVGDKTFEASWVQAVTNLGRFFAGPVGCLILLVGAAYLIWRSVDKLASAQRQRDQEARAASETLTREFTKVVTQGHELIADIAYSWAVTQALDRADADFDIAELRINGYATAVSEMKKEAPFEMRGRVMDFGGYTIEAENLIVRAQGQFEAGPHIKLATSIIRPHLEKVSPFADPPPETYRGPRPPAIFNPARNGQFFAVHESNIASLRATLRDVRSRAHELRTSLVSVDGRIRNRISPRS